MYTLEFNNMTPHTGQLLEVRLVESTSMLEAGRARIDQIPGAEFNVFLPFINSGKTYFVDFYADHSGNGVYNAPPADHAWRIELNDVEGDEDDEFVHNTNFTDIGWAYKFTLQAMNMNPHLGQLLELRLVNQATLEEAGRMRLDSIVLPGFAAAAIGLGLNEDYFIDFYADHNGNGVYDPPPADHAWRLELNNVTGDSELDFTHNTNFTDIQWPLTGINEISLSKYIQVYPNPVNDHFILTIDRDDMQGEMLNLYNAAGTLIRQIPVQQNQREIRVDMAGAISGIYYMNLKLSNGLNVSKTIIKL
jgi:hypothetical protein